MRTVLLTLAFVLAAAAARAQSPYVAGTIGADLSRISHTESSVSPAASSDSEVVSGSIRAGASVGQNWGVELEFVKSGRSHNQVSPNIYSPLASAVTSLTGAPAGIPTISVIAPYQSDVRQSHYDFDTVAWVRQRAGNSVDLVYVGGVA